ncbi:helix-turn-helix domain-containing protein [Neobacillus sp. NPDC093127]|uniref:helix-turn-helix domain-containing protein n=1 Tax=Neobacillus sp. NPDC093127 TaxID=3364296 RepID=UPI003803D5D1
MDFGRNFKKIRLQRGMDQKDVAAALGISPAFLSKVENNKKQPSIDLILNAADFYKVDPGFFFKGRNEVNLESLMTEKNKQFIYDLEHLTNEELNEKYDIRMDEKELSDNELKGIMAYVRSLRSIDQ